MHATADMRQAFVADVVARPADDVPRLVYADWLDDNGERDRTASDKLPWLTDAGRAVWLRWPALGGVPLDVVTTRAALPVDLWDAINPQFQVEFETPEAAQDALSVALLCLARGGGA